MVISTIPIGSTTLIWYYYHIQHLLNISNKKLIFKGKDSAISLYFEICT